ncbi:hypothetical protein [Microbispora sp. CA-102843]|uniref:hypothetical protein n=1 Tax=Microbispora sp. CA-102843 TaxID=3239952 RepID=UPI003D939AFD
MEVERDPPAERLRRAEGLVTDLEGEQQVPARGPQPTSATGPGTPDARTSSAYAASIARSNGFSFNWCRR